MKEQIKDDILISVIVPIFNTAQYLPRCIDSIMEQTYTNLEIILVDDASDDASPAICDAYVMKDSRVRCIHKSVNEGGPQAKRDGVAAASGDYVGFVDSDDWIEKDMYQKLAYHAIREEADIVSGGMLWDKLQNGKRIGVVCDHDGAEEGVYEKGRLDDLKKKVVFDEQYGYGSIMITVCSKIYKRALILPYLMRIPSERRMRAWYDLVYAFPPFLDAEKIVILHDCYYHYVNRLNSDSSTKGEGLLEDILGCLELSEEIYIYYKDEIQESFYGRCQQILIEHIWSICTDKAIGNDYREVREELHQIAQVEAIKRYQTKYHYKRKKYARILSMVMNGHYWQTYIYCRFIRCINLVESAGKRYLERAVEA